jgi:hypothetical protein
MLIETMLQQDVGSQPLHNLGTQLNCNCLSILLGSQHTRTNHSLMTNQLL